MPKSTVKEVAVYYNGCFISREGKVQLKEGRQNVVLDTLDNSLDRSSLSLALPENLKGSNVQVEPLNEEEKEKILREINDRITETDNIISIRQKQIEMWNVNADFSNKESLSITDMSEYIDRLPERVEKIYEEIRDLENKKKDLLKEKEDKIREANSYLVKADIVADKDGEYPFILRYKDSRAMWYPSYEIHTEESDELSLVLKARIVQYTQEDFDKARLSLFTTDPNISSDIPELNPQRLNCYVKNNRNMKMAMAGAMKLGMVMEDMVLEEENADMEMPMQPLGAMNRVSSMVGTSSKEDTMTKYELAGVYDLKKNKEIILDIEEKKVPCKYHVIAVPKMDDCGYLAANVQVNDIEEILDTNAVVYHGNTYIGEINIDVDIDKETYDISLGRDEMIRLKRKQNRRYTSNVILKGQKKIDFEYEINVNSAKDKPCKVTLIDQIPVSEDKTIVVDVDDISKAKLEEETGELTWEFDINPKENKTFDLKYSVSYPKDKTINL